MGDSRAYERLRELREELARAGHRDDRLAILRAIVAEVPSDPRSHYEYARELSRTGRHDADAIHEYRQALALAPDLAEAQLGLGVLYHRQRNPELAEASYAAAVRANPRLWRAWLNLGTLAASRKDYRSARRAYSRAAKLRPKEPVARQGLARAFLALGKAPEALMEWEAARTLDPDDPATLKGLAKTLGVLKDERAVGTYERAIEANPRSTSLPTEFSRLLCNAGDLDRAEEVLCRAAKANPGSASLWQELARFLRSQGRREEEMAALRDGLVQTAGDDRLRMELVRVLCANEQLAEAGRELRPLILASPRDGEARRLMAAVLACEGRHEDAATAAHAALRIDRLEPAPRLLLMHVPSRPQHPMAVPTGDDPKTLPTHRAYALAVRAALQLALGNAGEAGRLFDAAVKASPETALPRVGRALAYLATGNLEAAHAELRTAAILEPRDPHVQHLFGEAAFHMERYEEASHAFQAALADESADDVLRAYTFYCRARAFRKRGLTREAIESYTQAERLDPEYSPSFFGCGKALQETGRIEEALKHYERCVALSPRHALALQGRASCLAVLGRAPEAVEVYRAAIAADRTYALPRYNLAVLLDRTGNPEEVASLLRGYLKREPSGPYAEDARRRLRIAELRLTGALTPGEPLPEHDTAAAFISSSEDGALFEFGGERTPIDPRVRV
jgi:tetratricopeptide (TPR) repeat protein